MSVPTKILKVAGTFGSYGENGEDGGYYTPIITQTSETTARVSFTPSKDGMPAVADQNITLPVGPKGEAGPQGEKGDYGFYVGTEEPSDHTTTVWIDPDDEDTVDDDIVRVVNEYLVANPPTTGADGKSAYKYAQDGGYTGTEEEFAAKLAAEIPSQLPNPHKLVITGAVSAEYDGSEAVAVEIPVGESSQQSQREWELFQSITMEEETSGWIIGSVESLENAFSAKQYTEILLNFGALVPPASGASATLSLQVNNSGGGQNGVIKNLLSTSGNSYFSVHIQRTGSAWSKATAAESGAYASKYGIVFCPTQDKELCQSPYIAYVCIGTTMGAGTVITIYGR